MSIIFLVAYLVKRKKSNIWNVGKGYIQQNLIPFDRKGQRRPLPICKALTWNSDGKILFGGYDDGSIRGNRVGENYSSLNQVHEIIFDLQ